MFAAADGQLTVTIGGQSDPTAVPDLGLTLMRLYNTLTRQQEDFAPARDNTVRMYTCGLTVYARGHIGNFRTFVCVDVLRRALKYVAGYDMHHVMNFTDVDDKTIAGAAKAGRAAARIHRSVHRGVSRGCRGARHRAGRGHAARDRRRQSAGDGRHDQRARASAAIPTRSDGSIYFKIATLPTYGKLARLDHDGIQAGARVDSDEYDKEDARDFVLWKATKPGEPTWDYGCGPGRPGWHIECSAMALRLLGESPIDIHTGGVDLVFPHHENEIAQSEGATGRQFSRFWVHVEYLHVDNQKMSKSLGNVYTVQDMLDKGFRAVGAALSPAVGALPQAAQLHLDRPRAGRRGAAPHHRFPRPRRSADTRRQRIRRSPRASKEAVDAFDAALRDDLNTAAGLGAIFDLIRALNIAMDAKQVGKGDAPRSSPRSTTSIACSACCRCAGPRTPRRRFRRPRSTRRSRLARTPGAVATSARPIASARICSPRA